MTVIAERVEVLDVGHGTAATTVGLEIPEGLGFDEWRDIGDLILRIDDSSKWWIGDWLFYGEFAYGEKYQDVALKSGYDEKTLRNLSWVAGKIEMSRRGDSLSWSHHREVAALGRDDQDHYLDRAATLGWSVHDLRSVLAGTDGVLKPGSGAKPLFTLRPSADWIGRWCDAALGRGEEPREWAARILNVAAEHGLTADDIEESATRPIRER